MIGKEIGIYRIAEKLGQGGMGVVFKAVDMNLDRIVALKVLNSEVAEMPELVERFRSEARVQAGLSHPNLTTLYAFLVWEGLPVMVMEFIEGETFQQMIARRGPIPANVSVPLFRQALQGVGAAHRRGIIHRDIKPANIMLNEQGIVKVMDFGIAKVLGSSNATRTNMQMGTSWYMSPEQIMTNAVDSRSDVYSLGVTLYEMLAGAAPFEGASDFEVQMAHLEKVPDPPTIYYPHIPPHVVAATMKALEKRPENRFSSVDEFSAALDEGTVRIPTPIPTVTGHVAETAFLQPPKTPPLVTGNPAATAFVPPPPPPPVTAATGHAAGAAFIPPPQRSPKPALPKNALIAGGIVAVLALAGGLFYANSLSRQREIDRQRVVLQRQEAEKQRQAAIQREREQQIKAEEEQTARELTERVKREQSESEQAQAQDRARAAAAQAATQAAQRAAKERAGVVTPPPQTPPAPAPGADAAALQRLSGIWRGSYICAQGQTAAQLLIHATPQGVSAVLSFAVPNSAQPGTFLMNGAFVPATNQLLLQFVRWGIHPPGYVPANIAGIVNLQQGIITGRVIAPGCTTFQVRHQ